MCRDVEDNIEEAEARSFKYGEELAICDGKHFELITNIYPPH
jgi:hypothetical protein